MNMSDMTKKLYPVTGMHCAACAGNVEKIVRKQEGVENASVNLAAATLAVTYNPDIVSPQQLKEAVMKIGFDLIIDEDNSVQEQEEAEQSYYGQDYRCLDFCFTGSCFGDVSDECSGSKLVDAVAFTSCYFIFGAFFLYECLETDASAYQ